MKNGKVARKKKKDRVNAYIEPGLKKQAMQFMDSDEHYETYKNGRFGLLITNALKAYMARIIDEQTQSIVSGIIVDFTDRRGLRQQWEQIDDETQAEILTRWRGIVRQVLEGKG